MATKSDKRVWRFHNKVTELSEWLHWVRENSETYLEELTDIASKLVPDKDTGVTAEHMEQSVRIKDSLRQLTAQVQKLDKEVKKLRGKTIQRERFDGS